MTKSINVSDELHQQLEDYKIYDRERFEDVIKRAIQGELNLPEEFGSDVSKDQSKRR